MTPVKIGVMALYLSTEVTEVADVADLVLTDAVDWIGCWSSEAFPVMTCWVSLAEDSRQSLWSQANRVGVDQRSVPGRLCWGYYYCY